MYSEFLKNALYYKKIPPTFRSGLWKALYDDAARATHHEASADLKLFSKLQEKLMRTEAFAAKARKAGVNTAGADIEIQKLKDMFSTSSGAAQKTIDDVLEYFRKQK